MTSKARRISRRSALKTLALTTGPLIFSSASFGAAAPSKRIHVGMIGMGRQAVHVNLRPFLESPDVRVVAVAEVDGWRRKNAKKMVDRFYKSKDCVVYEDWRELVAREDIDAVMISTPDHWHVPMALAAVRAGKHVSCEKPLTLSVAEGRLLADEAKKAGVVFRTDSECRSTPQMYRSAELVRNGYIGALKRMEVRVPTGDCAGGNPEPMPVPKELDYDLWLGPAPLKPYTRDAVHAPKNYKRPGWMRCRDTCEGMITNWGTHLLDVAQLAHNSERSGPVEVQGSGRYPAPDSGLWNVLVDFQAAFRYADGVTIDYATGEAPYIRFEGEEGWVQSTWFSGGKYEAGLTASSEKLLSIKSDDLKEALPKRADKEDFIHAIKTGAPTMADAEIGHRTCSMGQIAHIAIQTGKTLPWDPVTERFADIAEANALLTRTIRGDWMQL